MSSRLYAKEFNFDKSSSIEQTIYQKLRNWNRNTCSFIHHVCYFSYHLSIAASKAQSLLTLFSIKMRGRKHNHKNMNILVTCYQNSVIPPLPSVKTIKNLRSSMRDTYIDRRLCISLMQMLKTFIILFINSELVRTLYSVGLLSNLCWKQLYIIFNVCL